MSAYFRKHQDLAEAAMAKLEPVRRIAEGIWSLSHRFRLNTHHGYLGILKVRYPLLHRRFCEAMDFVEATCPSARACFYPWASFAFNLGTVVSLLHKDLLNLLFGLCLIIPFGKFNHRVSCRLVVKELGCEFEVGAGIPLFIPSALYSHYNTELCDMGFRESFVAWIGGPVFQWADLGGCSLSSLSPAEMAAYLESLPSRIAQGLASFPLLCSS